MRKVIIINNIVYVNVTENALSLWDSHIPLIIVFNDNTMAEIDYREEIVYAQDQNVIICIEGGPIYPCISWDDKTSRRIIDGHWYTKISDTRFAFN